MKSTPFLVSAVLPLIAAAILIAGIPLKTPLAGENATIEMWAGHQVVFGETDVPVLGKRETRSDNYVLAKVTRRQHRIDIAQTACKVGFQEILGVKVRISEKALLGLPEAEFSFSQQGDVMKAEPWVVGWGRQDVDRDGKPGLTVEVDASICGGKLYVTSSTSSAAFGRMLDNGMMGKISVRVRQQILDTDSACLKMFSNDTDETQTGGFVYRRVQDNATCAELLKHPWPIVAKVKR